MTYASYLGRACSGCRGPSLGFAPLITTAVAVAPSIFNWAQSSDKAKDTARKAYIDDTFTRARAGDTAARDCLQSIATGGPLCGVGSKVAFDYGVARWNEYQQLASSGNIGSAVVHTAKAVLFSPMGLALLGGAVFLIARRRRA